MGKNSILTRVNLVKRGWRGSFCGSKETIDHLFFTCPVAKFCWSMVSCTFNFNNVPESMGDLMNNWLVKFKGKQRTLLAIGAAALSTWKSKGQLNERTNVIFSVCHWITYWVWVSKGC